MLAFILAGFGNGVADAAWNAWVGNLANSSELLGFLHAFYGVGGVISPLIATSLITKANLEWYSFYYMMVRTCCYSNFNKQTNPSNICFVSRLGSLASKPLR